MLSPKTNLWPLSNFAKLIIRLIRPLPLANFGRRIYTIWRIEKGFYKNIVDGRPGLVVMSGHRRSRSRVFKAQPLIPTRWIIFTFICCLKRPKVN